MVACRSFNSSVDRTATQQLRQHLQLRRVRLELFSAASLATSRQQQQLQGLVAVGLARGSQEQPRQSVHQRVDLGGAAGSTPVIAVAAKAEQQPHSATAFPPLWEARVRQLEDMQSHLVPAVKRLVRNVATWQHDKVMLPQPWYIPTWLDTLGPENPFTGAPRPLQQGRGGHGDGRGRGREQHGGGRGPGHRQSNQRR